jgi:hypothetical protein
LDGSNGALLRFGFWEQRCNERTDTEGDRAGDEG